MKQLKIIAPLIAALFLVGCVPAYQMPASDRTTSLEWSSTKGLRVLIHQDGVFKLAQGKLSADGSKRVINISYGKEIVFNARYKSYGDDYVTTCKVPFHFVPEKNTSYYMKFKLDGNKCRVGVFHKSLIGPIYPRKRQIP